MKLEDAFCDALYETCSSRLWYYKGKGIHKGFYWLVFLPSTEQRKRV